MSTQIPFQRVAVLGTGLMGGSFALAVRKHFPDAHVIGYDRADALARVEKS